MKRTRRIKILMESEQVFVIRKRAAALQSRCGRCGHLAEMATPEAAAAIVGLSVREICRLVEADKLHFFETPEGLLFICLDSLVQKTGRAYCGRVQMPL